MALNQFALASQRIAQLMEALPVGVFILDAAGTAVYENAAAVALLGRIISGGENKDNLAATYRAYIRGTSELYPADRMPIVRALAGERTSIDDMEIERHGRRTALEVTATPIFDDDGRVTYAVAVFQDITERRRAHAELEDEVARRTSELAETIEVLEQEISARRAFEEELLHAKTEAERASKAKSLFLMNVSHELRTPLNHIIGFNELIADRVDDARMRRLAETAGASGRDLLDKINDLIDLASAEAAPAERQNTTFDFDHVLDEVLRSAKALSGERRFLVARRANIGEMSANPEMVRRVLFDILQHAADNGDGEDVAVSIDDHSHADARHVVVSIPSRRLSERLRALTQLFGESAPPEETRFQQKEIDFRLAIARAHARRMGGDITAAVEDGRETLRVTLPTKG